MFLKLFIQNLMYLRQKLRRNWRRIKLVELSRNIEFIFHTNCAFILSFSTFKLLDLSSNLHGCVKCYIIVKLLEYAHRINLTCQSGDYRKIYSAVIDTYHANHTLKIYAEELHSYQINYQKCRSSIIAYRKNLLMKFLLYIVQKVLLWLCTSINYT